jgi:hypothetical protein
LEYAGPPARLVLYLMAHDELTAPPFEPFGSRMPRHFTGYHVLGPPIASIEFGAGNMGGLGILPGRAHFLNRPAVTLSLQIEGPVGTWGGGHRANSFPQRINDGRNRRLKKVLDDVAHATATNAVRHCARDILYIADAMGTMHPVACIKR